MIPRNLTDHQVNGLNERIVIKVMDEPGPGGAHHHYLMELVGSKPGETAIGVKQCHLEFQNGPIQEVGHNGFTHEALLAIVMDRLRCFQAGPHACRENALALTKVQEAMMWLNERTKGRVARGVEGTNQK